MQIRIITPLSTERKSYAPGQITDDFNDTQACELVQVGYAEFISEVKEFVTDVDATGLVEGGFMDDTQETKEETKEEEVDENKADISATKSKRRTKQD